MLYYWLLNWRYWRASSWGRLRINPSTPEDSGSLQRQITNDELTLFDGTGVGLKDFAVASTVVDLAIKKGVAIELELPQ